MQKLIWKDIYEIILVVWKWKEEIQLAISKKPTIKTVGLLVKELTSGIVK